MRRQAVRLPKRFPVGTKYVIEGRCDEDGVFHTSARYVLLPNGRHIDLPKKSIAHKTVSPSIVPRRAPALSRPRRARSRPEAARA
jgi:hypothetical protein